MFANDQGWSHKLHEAVATGLTAEAAVERVQSDTRARMLRSTDPYLRDRLHDLEDLGHRLMRQLVGQDHAPSREQLPDNAILIARAMGPAALLDYDRNKKLQDARNGDKPLFTSQAEVLADAAEGRHGSGRTLAVSS